MTPSALAYLQSLSTNPPGARELTLGIVSHEQPPVPSRPVANAAPGVSPLSPVRAFFPMARVFVPTPPRHLSHWATADQFELMLMPTHGRRVFVPEHLTMALDRAWRRETVGTP